MNETNLLAIVQQTATQTVADYTHWHLVNAFVWFSIGWLILALCLLSWKIFKTTIQDSENAFEWNIIIALIALIALLLIGDNVVNLIEPRAYAIHQLISDITH